MRLLVCGAVVLLLLLCGLVDCARKQKAKVYQHELIHSVASDRFQQEVLDPTVPVVVVMFPSADTTADSVFEVMTELAEAFDPFVEFRMIDVATDDGKNIAQQFGLGPQLALILFNPELLPVAGGSEGQFMKAPIPFQGELSAKQIANWILTTISVNHIERIEDDHDMAYFLAKYGHLDLPKIALVTKAKSMSPMFLWASHKYRYGGVFGLIDADAASDVLKRYHIDTLPSVLAFIPRKDQHDDVFRMTNVSAETTVTEFEQFVSQHVLPFEQRQSLRPLVYSEEHKLRVKEAEQAKFSKLLHPLAVGSQKQWVRKCLGLKKGNCLVVFMDKVTDESVPYDMLINVTRKVALKSQVPLQIVAVDGTVNYAMLGFFGVTNGMPDAVFLQPQKKHYINLVGSFSERGLVSFVLDKALKGTGAKAYKAKKVPKFRLAPKPEEEEEEEEEGSEAADGGDL